MTKGNDKVRIRGLVRMMNRVRDQLRSGIPPDEADDFRAMVRDATRAVERICRHHHIGPENLPAPSRRAYEYLHGLDLANLPTPGDRETRPQTTVRITGIISTCERYHRTFAKLVRDTDAVFAAESKPLQSLSAELHTEAEAIAALCAEAGADPAALPVRSRRGYQWLRLLGTPAYLAQHLRTLAYLTETGRQAFASHVSAGAQPPLQLRIFATPMLYRTRLKGRGHDVLVNEGFIDAPESVLDTLVEAALDQSSASAARETLQAYAASASFVDIQKALLATTEAHTSDAVGQYHDLVEAFARVNAAYFEGQLDQPKLVWSRRRTERKLGHYDALRDTLMVSQTLDSQHVPRYVVDYVIYHELLHKALGTERINGRRRAHTPAFRKAESAFERYEEAQAFIRSLNGQTD
ncbi:MAG: hypothetical protein ACP5HG_03340 [Anaerolineae bacterium]